MKSVNCDVIQDLLPNYIDKISSESTNELVEEHLQSCKKCQEALQSMSKDIDSKIIENQDDQIDYLKGFRKDKIKSNIKAVLIFIIITILVFTFVSQFWLYMIKFGLFISVNDVSAEYTYLSDTGELETFLYSEKYKYLHLDTHPSFVTGPNGIEEIYIRISGRGFSYNTSGSYESIKLDESIKRICLVDKKGNIKEIWNKDAKIMTEEEWKHWYIDSYVPQEIKDKYNITYDNILKLRGHDDEPFIWRQHYDSYYKIKQINT